MSANFQPPTNLWQVSEQLRFNEPLTDSSDPRYVDTSPGREMGYRRLLRNLGVDEQAGTLNARHARQYNLFCGHRGSGKSTELRRLKDRLSKPGLFRVIFLDVLEDLDVNSLQYPDVSLAMAKRLFAQLDSEDGLRIDPVFIKPLEDWFKQRVLVHEKFREVKATLESGVKSEAGIPFLSKIFANLTGAFQAGSKVRDEIRTDFRAAYSEFTRVFNTLVSHVEDRMSHSWGTQRLLFIIDGTDRLDAEDSARFFIQDVHQLQQLDGLFIYCAPIHLIHSSNAVRQGFDHIYRIPSLKLHEKGDPRSQAARSRVEPAFDVLRRLILKRAPAPLFEPDPEATGDWSTVDYFIENSGGHLRDLLRLLNYAFSQAVHDRFDAASAQAAVKALANDFKRFLQPEHYKTLAEVDCCGQEYVPSTEDTQRLLYNLALLEYNDYWWQSHPAVRTLTAYQEALKKCPEA